MEWLFNTDVYVARWGCALCEVFPEVTGWVHISGDLNIAGCYFALSMGILYAIYRRRSEQKLKRTGYLFAAFIFWCGLGHLVDAGIWWFPYYNLLAVTKTLTGLISDAALIYCIAQAPWLLAFKSPEQSRDMEARVLKSTRDIHAVTVGGVLKYVSSRSEAILGYTPEEMTGKRILDFMDEGAQGARTQELVRVEVEGDVDALVLRHAKKDGGAAWVRWTSREEDGEVYWCGRDVTALIEAKKNVTDLDASLQEAIRERDLQKALFRHVFDNAPIMVNAWDAAGNCIMWNPACARILGYSWVEVKEMENVHAVFYPGLKMQEASAEHVATAKGEFKTFDVMSRAGEIRHQMWANFRAPEGVVVGVGVDVTTDANARELLEMSIRELRQVNAELEQFAYVASHDLQEPLRKVIAMNDRARRFWDKFLGAVEGGDEDEARAHLEQVRSSMDNADKHTSRMRALIYDLLALSRALKDSPGAEPVDLMERIQLSLDTMAEKMHALGATVRLPEHPPPKVLACPTDIDRIFINLISNALKFHREGTPPIIRIEADLRDSDMVEVRVIDNGIGFPPEKATEILQAFKRLHRSRYEGTGLGLAITRSLVQRSGGSLSAQSREDGATFVFTVPVAPKEVDIDHT